MNPIARLIRMRARRYGVDPAAALAVATAEGGLRTGAVGDAGSSFGPFQLHVGGALPAGRGANWANSPAGIDYAIRQMSRSGARGLHGRAAVEAIVRNFERPAAPGAEINRAFSRYGEFAGGDGAVFANHPAKMQAARAVASAPPEVVQLAYHILQQNGLKLPPLQSFLPSGGSQAGTEGSRAVAFPGASPARLIAPVQGKLIGRPYQGTHTLYGNWESDNAVDIATPIGSPIRAVADGTIGSQFGSLGSSDSNLEGLRLHLVGARNEFYYAHLSRFAPGIHPGVHVRKGEIIGYSGEANGAAHLHFAVRHGHPLGVK